MNNKEHIESIIERTFNVIREIYDYQQEKFGRPKGDSGSRIIFPQKRQTKGEYITRVSEQELKQIFIEQLNKEINDEKEKWNVFYSVETPTTDIYLFSNVEKPLCGKEIEEINKERERDKQPLLKGQSANFDLVIHDMNLNRIALIEFKANNADDNDHAKDFKKLSNQEEGNNNVLRYFIEIIKSANKGTIESLNNKIKDYLNDGNITFKCILLTDSKEYKGDISQYILSHKK